MLLRSGTISILMWVEYQVLRTRAYNTTAYIELGKDIRL